MYKAIYQKTRGEIIILDPKWSESLNQLRTWDQDDLLVCQECQQPVRVRAGQIRARHFAHKHRQNCTIGDESPQLLQARAILYNWLVKKFGNERVTVEKQLKETELPRPVDCWVSGEPNFAYWIFEAGIKPQNREAIQNALEQPNIVPHWLFLATMLRRHQDEEDQIHLTTTERAFIKRTEYDEPDSQRGGSLHYLDHEAEQLTTYRGMWIVHPPQVYAGHPFSHPFADILTLSKTGEFIHPGEYERLKAYQEEQKRLEDEWRKQEERLQNISRFLPRSPIAELKLANPPTEEGFSMRGLIKPMQSVEPDLSSSGAGQNPIPSSSMVVQNSMGVCIFCGKETTDWWQYDGKTGTCRCRPCRQAGRA